MLMAITITTITLLFAAPKYALDELLFIMCIIIILGQMQTNKIQRIFIHITFFVFGFEVVIEGSSELVYEWSNHDSAKANFRKHKSKKHAWIKQWTGKSGITKHLKTAIVH